MYTREFAHSYPPRSCPLFHARFDAGSAIFLPPRVVRSRTHSNHIFLVLLEEIRICTVFGNRPKCRIFHRFSISSIFVLLKLTCLVTLFDRKLQVFKNSPKLAIFAIFNERLSTQNVNVAPFARNVKCDFLTCFETLW